jgi:hypothetical protein
MGPALLADPIAGFELFKRCSGPTGRFAPLAEFPAKQSVAFPPTGSILKMVWGITIGSWEKPEEHKLWDCFIDPTTGADPDPLSGPIPL